MNQSRPPNTTAQDPLLHLLGAVTLGASRSIEDMEQYGADMLRRSDVIPSDVVWRKEHRPATDSDLASLGFVLAPPFPDDPLFRPARLPTGWSERPGENANYWTELIDADGKIRASIFYKAAFYDRRAKMYLLGEGEAD